MNITRYTLPATIAAVFHAALLFGFTGKPAREVVTVTEAEVLLVSFCTTTMFAAAI